MHVSHISIGIIAFNMLAGILITILLLIVCKKRYRLGVSPFFVGCLVMILFAFGLEQIVHGLVLGSDIGEVIQNKFWLMALYGGLMAGLFEETGRFVAMKFWLKKQHNDDHNALLYGIGHGGFEMAYILVFGMLNNLIYAVMINSGQIEGLMAPLDTASQETLRAAVDALVSTPFYVFLLSLAERLAALAAQISLSVIVWIAVTRKGKKPLFLLAICLHMVIDTGAVLLNGLGVPTLLVELAVWICAAVYAFLAVKLWRANRQS